MIFDHELRREVLKVTMFFHHFTGAYWIFLAEKCPKLDLLAELVVRIHMQYGLFSIV